MGYLKAVLKKDSQSKIENLKKLIDIGSKLNKDTRPDEKKLEFLLGQYKANTENIQNKKEEKPQNKKHTSSSQYTIKSIYIENESIVINFYKKITNSDISFFELNRPNQYKDVFDIKGTFEKPSSVKLAVDKIDKITLGQFKKDVLRVVLTNRENLSSYYRLEEKRITIDLKRIKTPTKKIVQKEKKEKKKPEIKYVDKKNKIRSIYTDENQIIVKFNKNFSKKDLVYSAYEHKGRYEDVFDIKGKFAYAKPIKLKIDGIGRISVGQKKANTLRIRISDKKNYKIIYIIKKREFIIKIKNLSIQKQKAISKPKPVYIRPRTIVIDPGHGKRDVGAVGPNKRYEKVVTLKVSQALYKILKQKGHNVYLTRNKDTFIKVNNRTILANKKNADIFISVHANSVPKSKAHKVKGIETFFLSPARSERAKRVAAKENKTDIRNMSNSTKQAFLESLNRPRITASHKLAIDTQAGLLQSVRTQYKDVKDSGVREGPFWVLVGAQMPSILIELGYMSHPIESKRLYSKEYQELLAQGIANGIDSYFSKNP
jgi:N-acetylmuramoyl-L-alanine amidase